MSIRASGKGQHIALRTHMCLVVQRTVGARAWLEWKESGDIRRCSPSAGRGGGWGLGKDSACDFV